LIFMDKKNVAIVVGGGPAPGINGVISAATIEAIKRGHKVYGIHTGFKRISEGDTTAVSQLTIPAVSRIHNEGGSILGTSRANPRKSPEMLGKVVEVLKKFNVGYLVTIGGDDTATSAKAVAQAANREIAVTHVPKTIDNDLPLRGVTSTFGYQSAREVGTEIVETLMVDAMTTGRWYLVIAMGRKAGHLALGIGIASGATLSVIPEEFGETGLPLSVIVDVIVGSMLKRAVAGRSYGVAVLAEGLAEILDKESIPELATAERDPYGNIRFAEVDFGRLVKTAVKNRLKELGSKDVMVVDKNVGYELRCRPPIPFDREYTRMLGYGAIDFLLTGGTEAMITREGDKLVPVPFSQLIDPVTGRAKIRLVDVHSPQYKIARKYQIRLTEKNLNDPEFLKSMAGFTSKSPDELRETFMPSAAKWGTVPI
jgi:ATP-dependent phosphofructokinase / diphosphate-dependent phosphofructokinase